MTKDPNQMTNDDYIPTVEEAEESIVDEVIRDLLGMFINKPDFENSY